MKPQDLADTLVRPRRLLGDGPPPDARLVGQGFDLAIYLQGQAESGRRVLLVHGWETDHRDMEPIAAALAQAGLRCVSPDLPAHGGSKGDTMMIPDGAEALIAVDEKYGPFDLCVAHSMGCAIALVGVSKGMRIKAAAFLTPPTNYVKQLSLSARAAGAPEQLITAALDVLRARRSKLDEIDSLAMSKYLTMPGLVLVAGRDQVLDPRDARNLAAAWPNCTVLELPDASHRGVLRERVAIDAIVGLTR